MVDNKTIIWERTEANKEVFDKKKGEKIQEGVLSTITRKVGFKSAEVLTLEDVGGDSDFFEKQLDGDSFGFNPEIFPRNYMSFLNEKEENIKKYKKWFLKYLSNTASGFIFIKSGFFKYLYSNGYITENDLIENIKLRDLLYLGLIEDDFLIQEKNAHKGEYSFVNEEGENMANNYVEEDFIIRGIKQGANLEKLVKYLEKEY